MAERTTTFKKGDPVVVCGGKYNNKAGRIVKFHAVKISVKLRGIEKEVAVYFRQLRLRTAIVEQRFIYIPEAVNTATYTIAMAIWRAEYNDEHVFDRIRNKLAELGSDEE
jgi:hypothetical protein